MKLLLLYGTSEGQTRKIFNFIEQQAINGKHEVDLYDSTDSPPSPDGYDAVIIGGSVHAGRYQSSVEHYVKEYNEALNEIPGIFISVSLTAAGDEPESWKELREITEKFISNTGWNPTFTEQVAGALLYTKYNFLKKYIMRMIAQKNGGETDTSEDYEYTDWGQVKSVIEKLEAVSA